MSRYFETALQHRSDVDLRTVGPYTGNKIPWMGGMELPMKYAKCPTYPTFPMTNRMDWNMVYPMLLDWQPDLVIAVDAGINWTSRPLVSCPVVTVGTDPHVLDYDYARSISNHFFNMQKCYMKSVDEYLPYAFSVRDHYRTVTEKKYDAALVGMPYPNRISWVSELRARGVVTFFENGPVFDEYREIANQSLIGLNWSSLDDMVARVFEIMAMGLCPVINRVPDLGEFFTENVHYLGFSSMQEAIEKVLWAKNNEKDAHIIADNAHRLVWSPGVFSSAPQHSYCARVQQIFDVVGLE